MSYISSIPVDPENAAHELTEAGELTPQLASKSSIIDHELNRYGMGRYQWLIWGICGTGFLLDIMWTQAFPLAMANIQHELGFSDKEFGNIGISFVAGIGAGALMWGTLIDVVGRRVAFLATSLVGGLFGICIGTVSSYDSLLVVVAFTGIGVGGNIPVDSTIVAEYLPKDRFYLLAALSIFQSLGSVISTLLAFAFIPSYSCSTNLKSCRLTGGVTPCCSRDSNMGWRYLLFTVGSITLGVFVLRFFIFPFYESPKFLLAKGNDKSAVEVVHKVATFNKRNCDLTVESLCERSKDTSVPERIGFSQRLINEISRLKLLFGSWRTARITILVWITWIFYYWGPGIAGAYFPVILLRKGIAIQISVKQTYIDYMIIYTPGIAAVALSVFMVRAPAIGRKWTLVLSSLSMSLSIFLYTTVTTQAGHVGLNMLEFFCQSFFIATLFGWTPEAFPAAVRGTAVGWAVFLCTVFGIPSSVIAEQLFGSTNGSDAVLYMAASGVLVCTIAVLCIPTKDMVAPR